MVESEVKLAGGVFGAIGILAIVAVLIGSQVQAGRDIQFLTPSIGSNSSTVLNTNIACTYVIFHDGNNQTDAKNCSTGTIDYQNSDSYTVIEKAINSPAINQITGTSKIQGGLIFIKSGVYWISHPINLNVSSVTLAGENEQGTPIAGERHYSTVLKMANNTNLAEVLFVNAPVGVLYGDRVQDMFIDGNSLKASGSSTICVLEQTVADQQMENVQSDFCKNKAFQITNGIAGFYKDVHAETDNQGIYILGNVAGGGSIGNRFVGNYIDNANNSTSITLEGYTQGNTFTGNIIREDKGRCIYAFADSTTNFPARNTFVGNECMYITTSGNGLQAVDLFGSQNNMFTGNLIYNWGQSANNANDGFILHTLSGVSSINNTFTGNEIVSNGVTNHMRYAFNEVNSNQDFNVYTANNIAGMATRGMNVSGTHSIVRNNLGFKTENSGNQTMSAVSTTVAVTHGLDYTPNINDITITPRGNSNSCTSWWVTNPTSTQFTINCNFAPTATSLNFAWSIKRT